MMNNGATPSAEFTSSAKISVPLRIDVRILFNKGNHMKQYFANNFNYEAEASSEASILRMLQRR